jgi:hypothetical protein
MSTAQPEVRQAIEEVFADRNGRAELASLKDGYRNANPGQMEEGAAGKMMSRLTGVFQKKRALDPTELAQLKGADFHGLLYQRLRAADAVGEEVLRALATARAADAMTVLTAAGAPAARVLGAPAEAFTGDGNEIALKLELKPAAAGAK